MSTGQHAAESLDLPTPTLRLGGKEFACVQWVPQWHIMRLAKALSTGDEMDALAGFYDFLQVIVQPQEWNRFEAFMSTLDLERSDLDNAIGDVLVEMGGRGKASAGSSTPSSGGSSTPVTPPTSQVVSFSRGTVETVQPGLSDAAISSTV